MVLVKLISVDSRMKLKYNARIQFTKFVRLFVPVTSRFLRLFCVWFHWVERKQCMVAEIYGCCLWSTRTDLVRFRFPAVHNLLCLLTSFKNGSFFCSLKEPIGYLMLRLKLNSIAIFVRLKNFNGVNTQNNICEWKITKTGNRRSRDRFRQWQEI